MTADSRLTGPRLALQNYDSSSSPDADTARFEGALVSFVKASQSMSGLIWSS